MRQRALLLNWGIKMAHQLKPYDAVECQNINQWTSILQISAFSGFYILDVGRFTENPFLLFDSPENDSNLIDSSHSRNYKGNKLKINSFEDFCAKIKGEYKEKKGLCFLAKEGKLHLDCGHGMTRCLDYFNAELEDGKFILVMVDE
jgi:hypothetical protein